VRQRSPPASHCAQGCNTSTDPNVLLSLCALCHRLVQERISKDKMHLHVNAYQQMQYVCTQMAFFELKVGGTTNNNRDGESELRAVTVAVTVRIWQADALL